ncbi:MAG: potassium channel family protein [Butyricicoccaceae bacterium]
MTRARLCEIVSQGERHDTASRLYDVLVIVMVAASVVPLMFKRWSDQMIDGDLYVTLFFCIDYAVRWVTADCARPEAKHPFLSYPLTPMAVIELASIVPVLYVHVLMVFAEPSIQLLRIARALRGLRLFRVITFNSNFQRILRVLRRERDVLCAVLIVGVAYIFASAIIMFSLEPSNFPTFFDAVYWATITLATVGYGDITPITELGRLVSMISSILGIAIIALPSGIITSGFVEEFQEDMRRRESEQDEELISLRNRLAQLREESKRRQELYEERQALEDYYGSYDDLR